MMQHVATAKSEVAAFATGAQNNSFVGSKSDEQFGKVLQDQKSNHASTITREAPPPHSPTKKALQQSLDEMDRTPNSTERDSKIEQDKNASNKTADITHAQTSSSSKDNAELQSVSQDKTSDKSVASAAEKNDNSESESSAIFKQVEHSESASVDAQEWVALVNNLQKLADIELLTKQSLADGEVQSPEVAEADLKLSNEVEQSISILVGNVLEEVLATTETGELTDADIQNKAAELLLGQPEVFQELINQLNILSQKNDMTTDEQKNIDTIKNSLLTNNEIETDGPADVTIAENKALLRALLIDSETDKSSTQESVKLAKTALSEKLDQTQQTESLTPKLEDVVEQGALLEEDVQLTQVALDNLLNSSKTEKVPSNNDIKNILNLSDSKLDKVLENIAQRLFESKNTDEPINPEQIAQQVVIPKAPEIMSSVDSSSKNFISALKSGLEEFKNQLSQGREPGMDLKDLVADALAKTSDTTMVAKAPITLEQIVNSVSQVLDFAQTMNRAIEHHQDQTYSASLRDVAQIQGEQSKQIQLTQIESKFDKAVNIAKPEGHQQLAEKVRWMVNTKNLVAEIRLDPAELGSVHVKVAVSGESATVNFVVQSQQARDAVDTATPRLREMLAEKGIELGQSSVRQESDGQGQGDGELAGQGGRGNDEGEDVEVPQQVLAQQNIVNGALGGIDYFV